MSFIGNLIWIIFGGLMVCVGYVFGGLVICLTVVGIPVGWAYIKLGIATLAPFGKQCVVDPVKLDSPLYWVMNILWFVFIGWSMLINHLFWALVFSITIIGIPFAQQHLKLIPMSCFPYGRTLR